MEEYRDLLERFVQQSIKLLGNDLVGVYLHGSAAMGCMNAEKSDLDLLVVVKNNISDETKGKYMDMVVELNKEAPAKGLELSIVKETVCNPFVYPTPFELHFSIAHLEWYKSNPDDYIDKMMGTDKDLARTSLSSAIEGKLSMGMKSRMYFQLSAGRIILIAYGMTLKMPE
jgi:streptomycin 3"-adenylyltransferase